MFRAPAHPRWRPLVGGGCLGLALLAGATRPATAQSASVAFIQPLHGAVLENGSPFFLPAAEALLVSGIVTLPTGANPADYLLQLQGAQAPTLNPTATADTYSFSATLWIGPSTATYPGGGPVPPTYQYFVNMIDTRRLYLPIVAELVHVPTNTAVARARHVIHDVRFGGADPRTTQPDSPEGAAFQLTRQGLDAVERPHRDTIPWPTLDAFNATLGANAAGMAHAVTLETGFSKADKACIPLAQATALKDTPAWTAIQAEALEHYLAYQAAEEARDKGSVWLPAGFVPALLVQAGLNAYLAAECVREAPLLDDQYEVCVETLDGEMTDLTIAGTRDVNLEFPKSSRHVKADVTLGRVDGTVQARVADVFLRWAVKHGGCKLRPKATVAAEDLFVSPAMEAWSQCDGLEADALAARTFDYAKNKLRPLDFVIDVGSNPERLKVSRSGKSGVFSLAPDHEQVANIGTCAAFETKTTELLELFYPDMEAALNATWKANSPDMQQAGALDELTAAFEVGTNEPDDLALSFTFDALQSRLTFPAGTPPTATERAPDGLIATLTTNATLQDAAKVATPWTTWASAPPMPLDDLLSPNGQSVSGVPFDAAYTITTNAFNQMIRERSGTDLLVFTLAPTWADLGLAAGPAGEPATDPAVLTGTLLAQAISPAFSALGSYGVTITARPTLLPFTYIPVDQPTPPLPQFGVGDAPVTYQLAQFQVDVVSDHPTIKHALTLLVDMFDDAVDVRLHSTTGSTVLEVNLQNDQWQSMALASGLGCPLTPRVPLPLAMAPAPPACESPLVTRLTALVTPVLRDKLLQMLRTFPAPQVFTVPSATSQQLLELRHVDRFTSLQRIVLYGRLRAPQP